MADHPTSLSLSVLFCCYLPFTSASSYESTREVVWTVPPDTVQLHIDGSEVKHVRYNERHPPTLRFLNLSSHCIGTLPGPILSGLKGTCLKELPEFPSNRTLHVVTSACTCDFLRTLPAPANSSVCAKMLQGCGGSSVAVPVGVSLLLLLLLVVCGAGCVWHWRHQDRPPFALPRFLRRRSIQRKDYSKTLSVDPQEISSKAKALAQAHSPRAAPLQDHYENLAAGTPRAPDDGKGLYENTQPGADEEHVYGNEASCDYYNFHKPGSPAAPQDEDIYILPDAY